MGKSEKTQTRVDFVLFYFALFFCAKNEFHLSRKIMPTIDVLYKRWYNCVENYLKVVFVFICLG